MLLDTDTTPTATLDSHLVSFVAPQSFEAEQYRRLRQRIEDLGPARGLRVLAVTSAVATDGKTLTALNLAGSLAQAPNARILLIDADLRQPAVMRHLGLEARAGGWPEALKAPAGSLNKFVQPINQSGVDVLLGGGSRADTYELLRSPRFAVLIDEARRSYDYVIVDTPPIVAVPDGGLLGRCVDGYIVVVSANSTPRKLVGEALNLLQPNSVIGLVFNRDDRPLFGYYRSSYRKYYQSYVRSLDGSVV